MVKNIFLIDADNFFANSFFNKLNQRGNYDLRHFASFEDAQLEINRTEPEIILIEQNLKGKSGLEVIPVIRRNFPDVDVVMVSDQSDISVVEKAYDVGAVKYFRKDILLIDHIEGLIKERHSSTGSAWRRLFAT